MSWQDYVDNQLIASQCVSKACIAGHDGGVWAKSEGFEVSKSREIVEFRKKNSKPRKRKKNRPEISDAGSHISRFDLLITSQDVAQIATRGLPQSYRQLQ